MKENCICPGKFDKRITIYRLKSSLTPNAGGHVDETDDSNWQHVGKEWAACKTNGTREVLIDDQLRQFSTHIWTIRYSNTAATYATGMQLRMGGRKFNIAEPPFNQDEQNEWIIINTIEVPTV